MRHLKIWGLIICLLLFGLWSQASASETTYKDVPKTHWAYEAIESLAKAGILKGFPDGTFKPSQKVTREQFAVVLVLTLKLPTDDKAAQTFSDVDSNHRSFLYIDAAKTFIPTPYNPEGHFNFDGAKAITREEVAESIVVALDLKQNGNANSKYLSLMFKDYQSISPSFRENVALAVYSKMMSGNSNGTFNAKGALTRAELSVLMNKLSQLQKQTKTSPTGNKAPASGLPHKPWTIEFDFKPPDWDLVKRFIGTVSSKVYGPPDSYLVLENTTINYKNNRLSSVVKTAFMYVYGQEDVDSFFIGDMIIVDYDRKYNIIKYSFEREIKPHSYKPPIRNEVIKNN